jgi:hypothetical protein
MHKFIDTSFSEKRMTELNLSEDVKNCLLVLKHVMENYYDVANPFLREWESAYIMLSTGLKTFCSGKFDLEAKKKKFSELVKILEENEIVAIDGMNVVFICDENWFE